MSLNRQTRKILGWVSLGAKWIAISLGVYLLFNWDTATVEDGVITAAFVLVAAVANAFSQ
jgi:hypothetical protein